MPNGRLGGLDEAQVLEWFRNKFYMDFGLRRDAVTLTTDLHRDLAFDSLDEMNLAIALESEFGVDLVFAEEIRDDQGLFGDCKTLGDVIDLIIKKSNKSQGFLF